MKLERKVVPFFKPSIDDNDISAVVDILKSGWLSMGEKTILFEKKFCELIGSKNCIAVNSGTSALHIILDAMGIGAGDEVVIPANTFIATAEAVEYVGAKPVLADIDRKTFNISIESLKENISSKTKAIIPVHIAGQSCEMDEILELASENNLKVVDDAAHSLPTKYKGKFIGTISDASAFSFYATKPLMTGEGGMVTTENDDLAEIIRLKRLHGINKDAWNRYSDKGKWEYDVKTLGYKYNPTDIASAMGLSQLEKFELLNRQRKDIAERYSMNFRDCKLLEIPYITDYSTHSWHLYIVKLRTELLRINRDTVIEKLIENGIHPSVHFIPIYRFSFYKDDLTVDMFPNTEYNFQRIISLPVYPSLAGEDVDYVSDVLIDILRNNLK